jgi:hypothetical protein
VRPSSSQRFVASLFLFVGEVWAGAKGVLDLFGRFEAAAEIKNLLPEFLESPWLSPVLIVLGFGALWWTSRTPPEHGPLLLNDKGEAIKQTTKRVLPFAGIATGLALLLVIALLVVVVRSPLSQVTAPGIPVPTAAHLNPGTAPKATTPATTPAKRQRLVIRPASANACLANAKGKYHSDYSQLPGGPNEKRPWLAVSLGESNGGFGLLDGDSFFLVQLTLVNRGEASIAKDWTLCLVEDGNITRYRVSEIPVAGFPVQADKTVITIRPSESLAEKTIATPIPHGNAVMGWLFFRIPGRAVYDRYKEQHSKEFAIQFKDYLEHEVMVDGKWQDGPPKLYYVPGTK